MTSGRLRSRSRHAPVHGAARVTGAAAVAGAAVVVLGLFAVVPAFAASEITSGATVNAPAERGIQTQVVAPPAPNSATFRVTLTFDWTTATHPGSLPSNAHFSGPVIAVHSSAGAMFEHGAPATQGIENMAERGSQSVLRSELQNSSAVSWFDSAAGTGSVGTGTRSFVVSVTQESHLVSLVSMLAPSSDWFVGMRNVDLFVGGAWVSDSTFDASNYDAGTRNGDHFNVGNDTSPRGVITGPVDAGFSAAAAQNPFATITITRTG